MTDLHEIIRGRVREIAPDVFYVPAMMANVFFIGKPDGPRVMVDAGVPGTATWIRAAAEDVFAGEKPQAIILTHGHFDHTGALGELAAEWDVPVYAHRLELPYLDGRDDYPPPDPTVGGFMAQLSRMFSAKGMDLGHRLRVLHEDGAVPFLDDWRYLHTPGHTHGHISLFRESDRTLIAGDAFITVDQQNPVKLISQVCELHTPPIYFTSDWELSRQSVVKLAGLQPQVVATGHGLPMSGSDVPAQLAEFAASFRPPESGRYVGNPALADEQGVFYVPPKPYDPLPMYAAGAAVIAAAGLLAWGLSQRGTKEREARALTDAQS